jgi:hypothetical protein
MGSVVLVAARPELKTRLDGLRATNSTEVE